MSAHDPLQGYVQVGNKIAGAQTPAGYLARRETLYLYCSDLECRRKVPARTLDMEQLVDRGWGAVGISQILGRLRCQACGAGRPETRLHVLPGGDASPMSQARQLVIRRDA